MDEALIVCSYRSLSAGGIGQEMLGSTIDPLFAVLTASQTLTHLYTMFGEAMFPCIINFGKSRGLASVLCKTEKCTGWSMSLFFAD